MTTTDAHAAMHRLHRRAYYMKLEAANALLHAAFESMDDEALGLALAVEDALKRLLAHTEGKLSGEGVGE